MYVYNTRCRNWFENFKSFLFGNHDDCGIHCYCSRLCGGEDGGGSSKFGNNICGCPYHCDEKIPVTATMEYGIDIADIGEFEFFACRDH